MKYFAIFLVLVIALALWLARGLLATPEAPNAAENEARLQQDPAHYSVEMIMIEQDGVEPPSMMTAPRFTVIEGRPGVLSLKDEKRSLEFVLTVKPTKPTDFEVENLPSTHLDGRNFGNAEELLKAIGEAREANQ